MITKPTVLVLGAGASMPFGFPSGLDLIDRICIRVNQVDDQIINVLRILDIGTDELSAFSKDLKLAAPQSIDEFLDNRQDYLDIGKALISVVIAESEVPDKLLGIVEPQRHWYRYLFSKMICNLEDFNLNQLTVITFNYDRSLEFYLWNVIRSTFDLTEENTSQLLSETIDIIHIHGQLGTLSNIHPDGRPYMPTLDRKELSNCISGIQIIHEATTDLPDISKAKISLKTSEIVCFLGFGYHQFSLDRLNIRDTLAGKRQQNLIGSSFGLTNKERSIIIRNRFGISMTMDGVGRKDLNFLRHYSPFD